MKTIFFVAILFTAALAADATKKKTPPTNLQIGILRHAEKCDRKSKPGDMLSMHYKGYLFSTGEVFDSSYDRNEPLRFKIGAGNVIKGWDQGLLGMCVGEKRKLTIPPQLAYGDRGAGSKIPGGATLVFETELVKIEDDDKSDL